MSRLPAILAREGDTYVYRGTSPPECRGHRYRLVHFVLDVPSYQKKILMVAMTGPDAGLWFVCTEANFADRYEPAPVEERPPDPPIPEKVAGYVQQGSGA